MNRSCNAHPEPFSAHAGEDVSRVAPRASIKFLADAFAVWCDQKSRLAGARATEVRRGAAADSENAVLDDDGHDALSEAYARTRELISALIVRAETIERTARQAPRPPRTKPRRSSAPSAVRLPCSQTITAEDAEERKARPSQ